MSNKAKTFNNILLNVFIGFLSIVLVAFVFTGMQVKLLNQDYANFFGYSLFEVKTNSMKPAINGGDWIIVKINEEAKLGDVITYKKGNDFITHRVKEVHANSVVAMGDANSGKDEPVSTNDIVGTMVRRLPKFGVFRNTVFNPYILILLIVMLYLLESILKDQEEVESDKEVKENFITKKINEYKKSLNESKKAEENLFKEKRKTKVEETKEIVVELPKKEEVKEESIIEVQEDKKEEPKEIIMNEKDSSLEEELKESEEEDLKDEDYEETKFFRMITVDVDETNKTLLETAQIEIEKEEPKKVEEKIIEEEITEESLTNIDISLIEKKLRRHKNVLDGFVNIKTSQLEELVDLLNKGAKPLVNEATIRNKLTEVYINARYYNYYYDIDLKYRGRNPLIMYDRILKHFKKDLTEKYKGPDNNYKDKANNNYLTFKLITKLERGNENLESITLKREFYKDEISKVYKDYTKQEVADIAAEVIKVMRAYDKVLNDFKAKVISKDFEIKETKVNDELTSADLVHNLNFNKIYSDYIIDKTYYEGVVAEDKLIVLLNMLSSKLIDNMLVKDFKTNYIINIPSSLYGKRTKLNRTFNVIEDEFAKSHVYTLISFKDLIKHKKEVTVLKKKGYKFAVHFAENDKLLAKDKKVLYLTHIIFNNKIKGLATYVPSDIKKNIVNYNIYDNYERAEEE